jgi:hypothetical protein
VVAKRAQQVVAANDPILPPRHRAADPGPAVRVAVGIAATVRGIGAPGTTIAAADLRRRAIAIILLPRITTEIAITTTIIHHPTTIIITRRRRTSIRGTSIRRRPGTMIAAGVRHHRNLRRKIAPARRPVVGMAVVARKDRRAYRF